jgi:hypothetical protein
VLGGDGRTDPVHAAGKVDEIFIVEGLGEGLPQELVVPP